VKLSPLQVHDTPKRVDRILTERAYQVYDHLWPGQPLDRMDQRGGLSIGELIAFLYARSFPTDQWRARVDEAIRAIAAGRKP